MIEDNCEWCGKQKPITWLVNGFTVCTTCKAGYSFRRRAYANQRLTVPRKSDNDCSNNCDIGYHERCNDDECPCACHNKEPT